MERVMERHSPHPSPERCQWFSKTKSKLCLLRRPVYSRAGYATQEGQTIYANKICSFTWVCGYPLRTQNPASQEAEERHRQALLAEEGTIGANSMMTQDQGDGDGILGGDEIGFPAWRLMLRRIVQHDKFQVNRVPRMYPHPLKKNHKVSTVMEIPLTSRSTNNTRETLMVVLEQIDHIRF